MLGQRIATGAVLGIGVVVAIGWLSPIYAGIVLGLFWLIGVAEWAGFAQLTRAAMLVYVAAAGLAMLAGTWVLSERGVIYGVLGIAVAWWLVAIAALYRHPRPIARPLTAAAGYAVLVPAWLLLVFVHAQPARGPIWVLILLAIVWSADIGAYVVGRLLGKHKLAPTVSPGKTWEGVAGGLVSASAVGALAGAVLGLRVPELALLAAVTAAGSIVGDLTVSLFKRNAGLKDSGHLLPGHGGVLDRIDSLTAAVAVFVLGLLAIGIIT